MPGGVWAPVPISPPGVAVIRQAILWYQLNGAWKLFSRMPKDELLEERLTESIIGAFYEVYNRLGYGFFETAYSKALAIELGYRGHDVHREVGVDLYYKGHRIGHQRIDLIIDEKVILEIKSSEDLPKGVYRQCYSYLRACGLQVGLILHFGPEPRIKRIRCRGAQLGPNTEVVFPIHEEPDSQSDDPDFGEEGDATGSPA